jgi:hypothetical protein
MSSYSELDDFVEFMKERGVPDCCFVNNKGGINFNPDIISGSYRDLQSLDITFNYFNMLYLKEMLGNVLLSKCFHIPTIGNGLCTLNTALAFLVLMGKLKPDEPYEKYRNQFLINQGFNPSNPNPNNLDVTNAYIALQSFISDKYNIHFNVFVIDLNLELVSQPVINHSALHSDTIFSIVYNNHVTGLYLCDSDREELYDILSNFLRT